MSSFKSTTDKGNSLRDAVFSIVKTAQKINCEVEKPIDGKNIDVYYEEPDPIRRSTIKYGVECKYYGHPLRRGDYDKIIATYTSPLMTGVIDYLIIVTDLPPTPGILQSVENNNKVAHHTFVDFSSTIMDFSQYLNSIVATFNNDGLSNYYVPVRDLSGDDIEKSIDNWICSENSNPLAILAGYGMGKTSLSIKLASNYAKQCISGDISRIPIYLKLGDIFNEQGLEGLVCKYFASHYNVRGFTYPLFLEFNRLGRFFIILDGFDEMKHAMSFSAFKSNIKEFNKLVVNRSKVIILGRPNAFTSEDEKASVLHGIKYLGDKEIRDAEMQNYDEIHVSPFSHEQLCEFIPKFVSYTATQDNVRRYDFINDSFCRARIDELLNEKHRELISRPVHARMLVQIALGTDALLSSFTTYHLYETFFTQILERENTRPARQKIKPELRERFVEKLAWERWLKGGDRVFSFEDITQINFDLGTEELPRKDILRDLVIGSVVESKGGNYYYFAHRSFQEFLVSQHILRLEWTAKTIGDIDKAMGSNVIDFISESGKRAQFVDHLADQLNFYDGEISTKLFRLLRKELYPESSDSSEIFINPQITCPWHALLASSSHHTIGARDFRASLYRLYSNTTDNDIKLAIFCGLTIRALGVSTNSYRQALLLLDLMHYQLYPVINKTHIHNRKISDFVIENEFDRIILASFLSSSTAVFNNDNELTHIQFDTKLLGEKLFYAASRRRFYLSDIEELYIIENPKHALVSVRDIGGFLSSIHTIKNHRNPEEIARCESKIRESRKKITQFWSASPSSNTLVPVRKNLDTAQKRSTLKLKRDHYS